MRKPLPASSSFRGGRGDLPFIRGYTASIALRSGQRSCWPCRQFRAKPEGAAARPPAQCSLLSFFRSRQHPSMPPTPFPPFGKGPSRSVSTRITSADPARPRRRRSSPSSPNSWKESRPGPLHRHAGPPETVLYAGYFLAALHAKGDFRQAVAAREALFEAAGEDQGEGGAGGFPGKGSIPALRHGAGLQDLRNYLKEDGSIQRPPGHPRSEGKTDPVRARTRSRKGSATSGNRRRAVRRSPALRSGPPGPRRGPPGPV